MRFFLLISLSFSLKISFSQCAGFDFAEIGYEPAACRTAWYQTGNGVVYAVATGGTEPYSYTWTNLQTGQTSNNTTWGGLNIGLYEIYATDAIGCVLIDTMEVDSVNPLASFQIVSNDFDSTGMFAFLPFEAELEITADICYMAQPDYPDFDTNFYWQLETGGSWILSDCYPSQTISITTEGTYAISLVYLNNNGCTDTLTQTILAVLPTYAPSTPAVYCIYETGEVVINFPENQSGVFVLCTTNGIISATIPLEPGLNTLQIDAGISFYQIVVGTEEVQRGKLVSGK